MYNAEGYVDPTAYFALKGGFMGYEANSPFLNGDIVTMETLNGREIYKVILKVHDGYATTLPLFDRESNQNEYKVKAKGVMHADRGKVTYTAFRDLEAAQLVRHMEDGEFSKLLKAIGATIGAGDVFTGIGNETEAAVEIIKLREQVEKLEQEKNSLIEDLAQAEKKETLLAMEEAQSNNESEKKYMNQIIKAEAERDVYKELYFGLLDKMRAAG
jgi:hypothetical protein